MNYYLLHDGQEAGPFSIYELRRRRDAGELSGSVLVRREDGSVSQPLDSILNAGLPSRPSPPPLPAATRKSLHPILILAVVAGVIAFVTVFAVMTAKKVRERISRIIESESPAVSANDRGESAVLARQPVAANTNSVTEAKLMEQRRQFRVRQYLEGYEQRGQRDPSSDADALGLIRNWIAENYGGTFDTNLPPLPELSDKLAGNPACTDPIVQMIAGVNSVEARESIRRFERAIKNFDGSRHRAYPKFYAHVVLASKLITDRPDRLPGLDAAAVKFLMESFTDGSLLPEDQPEIAEVLVGGWAETFFRRNGAKVCSTARAQGKKFEWLALVLEGDREIALAWKARGGGYSDKVTEQGWKDFAAHLEMARGRLTKAWELRPELPLAPCRMIYVSLGDSGFAEMRRWFDRTVAAQIDYPLAWRDMRWGLRPRWYGDSEAMLAFGTTALKTHRFDTDVPRIFFDSVKDVESEMALPRGEHIYGNEHVWPYLKELYEGYLAEPSQAKRWEGWRNTYAVVAYLAGQYEISRKQLEELHWRVRPYNLTGWGRDLSLMALEVAARTGPSAPEITAAETQRELGDFPTALRLYTELAARANLDDRTRRFVQDRLATLDLERRLQAGEWVNFLPAAGTNPPGWCLVLGKFQLNDGVVEVRSGKEGHMLYCRARVGTEFEAKGRFEVLSTTTKAFQAGLVLGTPEPDTVGWNAFRVKRNADEGDIATFSQRWSRTRIVNPATVNADVNAFELRFHDGKVTASVNGTEVFREIAPPANPSVNTNEFLLGLGAFNNVNETVIRYRELRVRRISTP